MLFYLQFARLRRSLRRRGTHDVITQPAQPTWHHGSRGRLQPHSWDVSAATEDTLRPFRINVSEEVLVDLRRRVAATRWLGRETAQGRFGAASKRGFQTCDAEMDPARLLGDLD